MQCSETGQHEVIRLPHVPLSLAQELEQAIASMHLFNGGNGSITLQMRDGHVPSIDVLMRHFRRTPKLIKFDKAS